MISQVDTLFVLIGALMVILMTPALSAFYAGLGRARSGVDVMMQVWICFAIVGVIWIVFGFSMAFGDDIGGIIGGMNYALFKDVGMDANECFGTRIPFVVFFLLQISYAIITPALIAGAVLEKMELKSYIIFVTIWSVVVYLPLVHMVWGGGILASHGFMDYGGGTVIHGSAGFSSLAAVLLLGKRRDMDETPSNMAQVSVNCGLLLFGWFAFNAAGACALNANSIYAAVNSLIGTIVGMFIWVLWSWIRTGKPSFLQAMFGFLAGLVAVTPASEAMSPRQAIFMAIIVSVLCYIAINFVRPMAGFDDSLDVWGLHGIGGITGCILIPLFVDKSIVGMPHSLGSQLGLQIVCALGCCTFAFIMTLVILKVMSCFMKLRNDTQVETYIDKSRYSEKIYNKLEQ